MKVSKRITALILALCLVFQLVPAYAGAAETGAAITVSDYQTYPGSYAYINIEASGLKDLASLDLEIYYDSDALRLNSCTNGSLLSGGVVSVNSDTPGVIRLSAAWTQPVTGSGRLLRLSFAVSSDCNPGKIRVKAAVGDAYDVHLHPAAISGGTGTVTVQSRPASMGQFSSSLSFPDGSEFSQGDSFTVTLCGNYNAFASADFTLEYDSELLELQSVKLRSDLTVEGAVYSVNTAIAGLVKISYASVSEINTYYLADCVFKVREDVNITTSLTFRASDVYSIDLIPYEPGTDTRTITIKKASTGPDYSKLSLSELPDEVGQEGTAVLTLEEGAGVAAADFTVRYDPQVYACLEVVTDENLSETGGMVVINPAYDEGVIRFSYINETDFKEEIPLVKIRWKCLSSPGEHTQVKPGGSNVVNLNFGRVNLDYVVSTHCIFDSFRVEPGCTVDGEEGLRCNACGEKRDITLTPATGHHYGAAVTPPTCIEQGYTTYTCPDCGDSYVADYTDPTGHSYGQWYTVTPPTCTETGIQKHDCKDCDHTEEAVLQELGHSYKNGSCIRCGAPETYLEEGKCGDNLYWRMGTDGTLVVFGTGDMYDFGYSETGPWNAYKDSITKVIVNEGATTVGSNAFNNYAAILSVEFPSSLRELKSSSFAYCKGLREVTLSGELKRIESSAFSGCSGLVSVTLPEGLESIGSSAFSSCGALKGIVIPDSVTFIGSFAFSNCRNMEYANIPEGVTTLGTMAFYSCRNLKEIAIPESMVSIGEYAFENCASLTTLTVPAGVQSIASRAFLSCTALKELYIYSENCTIAENVFTATTTLFCYEGSTAQAHGQQYGIAWCAAPAGEELGHRYTSYVKEPSCTERGWTVHTCSRCDSSYEDSFVEMLPHSYGDWYTVSAATCTQDGEERHDCIACGHFETRVLNKLGHDYAASVTDPTCTQQGYTTHTCSRCDDTYVDSYVAALGHSYGDWHTVTVPTCTSDGYERRDCVRCDHYETNNLNRLGHDYVATVTEPTCVDRGYTTHTCSRCDDTYVDSYVAALGHSYGSWYTVTAPTCTTDGHERRDCVRCDHYETNNLNRLGHDYVATVAEPTCVDRGYTTHTCSRCDDTYVDSYVAALGHSYGDWYTVTAPSCTQDGTERHDCIRCDHSESRVLNKLGHDYVATVTAPTCLEQGYTTHSCSRCDAGYVDAYVAALGHDYGDWITDKAPNCTEEGSAHRECSRCDSVETKVLPANGHSYTSVVTAPTCTERGYTTHTCHCGHSYVDAYVNPLGHDHKARVTAPTCTERGYTTYTCSRCGDSYMDNYVDPLGHDMGPWVTEREATCTEEGQERRDCARCDYFETQALPLLDHSYSTVVTAPTCLEQGYTTYTCHCGHSYVSDYTAALGHDWDEGTVTVPPTEESEGEMLHTCLRCGATKTEVIPELEHIHSYNAAVTAPTCTEDGYTTHTCRCGDRYVDSYVAALGHDHKATVTAPTCTDKGYTTHVCSRCADTYTDSPVAALGHDYGEWITDKAATCLEDGSAHRECSRCDSVETKVLPASGHSYTHEVTAPTCLDRGYTTHTCHCGHSYVDSYVAALGHDYKAVVTAPTCTEQGYTTYNCSRCDASFVDSYVAALGHDYGEWITDKAATCLEDGSAHRECSRCDSRETKGLTKLGHNYEEIVTAPTCTERGYTTHSCSRCDASFVDSYVAALGHDYGGWYTVKAPTCTEDGEEQHDCSRCDAIETRVASRLGHDYKQTVTAPTCTEKGYTTYTCSRCADSYVDTYVDALGHDYGDWITDKAANCTDEGSAHRECSRCDSRETKTLPATGHSYTHVVTAPTCEEAGYTTHTCHCGHSYVDSYVTALGHDWDEGTVTVPPTEESEGERLHTCLRCGESKTEVIPELGHTHSYTAAVTAPTCTERGYTTYTCRCGDNYVDNYVDALGHAYGDWYTAVAATCTADGSERRDCERCDHSETSVLTSLGHDYKASVTEPTCEERGYTTYSCSRCDSSYTDHYVPALGHDYDAEVTVPTCTEDGYTTHTCSRCGDSYMDASTEALGHDWDEGVVKKQPTEEETGEMLHTCLRCGETKTEIIPEIGHTHSYTSQVTEPTCTEDGYTTYTCRCGHTMVLEQVPALGHVYEVTVTEPTCTEAGYTTHICSRCGDEYTDSVTDPLGHAWDDGVITREPTEQAAGEKLYTCTRCGETRTEVIPATGHTHSYIAVTTEPTCTEKGYTTFTCSCGDSYVEDYVAALGHDFADGECTRCGEDDPDYQEPTQPTEPEEPEQPALSGVYRIAGADRIGTSLGIADQLKAALGVEKFSAVIVASALNFPDALTGSYLAAVKNAPILLTYEAAHPKIRAYIQENLIPGGTVYILGGEGAVSASFATGLNGFNVKRVAGSDRFGTNLEIMKEAGVSADQPVLIATALNFADSLSASAAGLPMVLVYGTLREDQKAFLATTSRNFIIIGGTSAVSEELEAELRAIGSVDRLAGAGRYQTSVMVAQRFVRNPDAVVLAYARNFPDGLCGGPLAYALNAPLILTDNYDPATADAYVQGISAGFVAGGAGLISDDSVKEIFDLAANASVPLK